MGLFKNVKAITGTIDKAIGLADQAITDKDKYYEMKFELEKLRTQLMLSGKGSSITKITICALVSLVVIVGGLVYIFKPEQIRLFKDYALQITPLLGILVGAYGTGKVFKTKIERNEK